jgi:hypothetical protein
VQGNIYAQHEEPYYKRAFYRGYNYIIEVMFCLLCPFCQTLEKQGPEHKPETQNKQNNPDRQCQFNGDFDEHFIATAHKALRFL